MALKWVLRLSSLLLVLAMVVFVLATSARPSVALRPAPTAEQVAAARGAIRALLGNADEQGKAIPALLTPDHLDGLSALGSHGLRPDRLDIYLNNARLHIDGSHGLPLGRWLNVSATLQPQTGPVPSVQLKIGSLNLSPSMSRMLIDLAASLSWLGGVEVPTFEETITGFRVEGDMLSLSVNLPANRVALSRLFQIRSRLDASKVVDVYCRLAAAQRRDPQPELVTQLRRAFPSQDAADATADGNRAAFVALGMFIVDTRVGALVGVNSSMIARCPTPAMAFMLHGRGDLPKHWALSAALAAGSGKQIAEAMGDWKELEDSLSHKTAFGPGHGTGFSFIDISADRAGFWAAEAAGSQGKPAVMAARLSRATANDVLPVKLLAKKEGLYAEFTQDYGGLDDPRYAQAVREIDAVLDAEGLSRGMR